MTARPLKWVALTGILCVCWITMARVDSQDSSTSQMIEDLLPDSGTSSSTFSDAEIKAAQTLGQSVSIAEWLGPMAPVALSPFFGITCLSGMALFGGKWISAGNPLLSESSPLHNPAVFWTFLSLTIVTSIPRFTKVSKPFAQAVDQLESWSGIVTMIAIRILMLSAAETTEAPEVLQAGMISLSFDVLMMVAAAVNIVVINTVKFFFEVLIWLTPVPFLDATFELLNKTLCLALMVVYAWSPAVALVLNLALFVIAAVIFGWAHRREVFFHTMLLDFVLVFFTKATPGSSIVVFPTCPVGKIKTRAKCRLERTSTGWILRHRPLLRPAIEVTIGDNDSPSITCGIFTNTMTFSQPSLQLTFSQLYNANLPTLANNLKALLTSDAHPVTQASTEFV